MREKKKNSQVCGMDHGTGFSKGAYLDETGRPKVIPNRDGGAKTPSIVYFSPDSQEVLVGVAAESMMFVAPERTVKEAKRDIGSAKVYLVVNGVNVTPVTVATKIFEYLRQSAIEYFGDDLAAREVVVTVPAAFKDDQRQAIKLAAEMAGITVLQLINEPMAAALAFGLSENRGDMLVAVADFGQGTFDVAIVQFGGGRADVIASAGDPKLGGKDVDEIPLEMVKEKFKAEHGIDISEKHCPADLYGIWSECVRAKELLSSKREVKLVARAENKQVVLDITREQLNKAIAPLMSRVKNVTLQAIQDAKLDVGDVDHVLLIGGSSRIPAFKKTIADIFGEKKIMGGSVSPDTAVAEGAAIKAGQLVWKSGGVLVDNNLQAIPAPAIESRDVMPHSLGVAVQDRVSSALYCAVILEKNTPIPHTLSKRFASVEPEQDKFKVIVLQGEDGQAIKDCLIVGEKELTLPPRSPEEESLEVTMAYDESGMVDVNVKDLVSGKTANITVDHYQKERAKQGAGAAKQAPQSKGRKGPCKAKKV